MPFNIAFFILSLALAIAEIFSLGLVVVALASTQAVASTVGGVLFIVLLFLSGLRVQPVQVGEPLRAIMYYSPVGAAVRALLYSVFNATPPAATLAALAGYAVVFGVRRRTVVSLGVTPGRTVSRLDVLDRFSPFGPSPRVDGHAARTRADPSREDGRPSWQ